MSEYHVIHSKSPVFYDEYERKAELQHQTHYCPGCGHGVAHKLIAETLSDMGLQDRAIFVSPVGCSVFAYYYFDTGNIQAAHGRAPAVATAAKRSRPDSIVISYQGDGDLAAIGTAEIVHAANRGESICVFFINNAIYGMTGGQMAPTTLIGQVSTTSPWGRREKWEGFPLHVCELLATLEAPVYIERVALSDNKNVMKARRAVRKAIENQKNGLGFSLVEILSPCPTIWKMDPVVARHWVGDVLMKTFPLGVFRDKQPEALDPKLPPQRTVAEVLEIEAAVPDTSAMSAAGSASNVQRSAPEDAAPTPARCTLDAVPVASRDLAIKIAGFGGQGVLLLGQMIAEMGMREGLEVSWLPSYGPEMRSGSAHCHVRLSRERIGAPLISKPDVLIAMNEVSLRKFAHTVAPGGVIFYNRDKLPADFSCDQARVICLSASEVADQIGSAKVANVVMLGALLEETECLSFDTARAVIQRMVKNPKMLELDYKALAAGRDFEDREMHVGSVPQPDGYCY